MSYRLLFGWLIVALVSSPTYAITVDELVAKNAEARGGLAKFEAIKTMRTEGQVRVGGDYGSFDLKMLQVKKAPESVRNEASVQGLTQVEVWNGKQGWKIDPFQGRKDAERMTNDDARGLADDANIAGPLINYNAQGNTIAYQGTEDVDGTQAHKLKVTLKNGDVQTVYLDPDHFIEIRTVSQRKVRGTEVEETSDYGDYELVDGVYFPFSITTRSKGQDGQQQVTIEKAEANVAVDDALFTMPTKAGSTP